MSAGLVERLQRRARAGDVSVLPDLILVSSAHEASLYDFLPAIVRARQSKEVSDAVEQSGLCLTRGYANEAAAARDGRLCVTAHELAFFSLMGGHSELWRVFRDGRYVDVIGHSVQGRMENAYLVRRDAVRAATREEEVARAEELCASGSSCVADAGFALVLEHQYAAGPEPAFVLGMQRFLFRNLGNFLQIANCVAGIGAYGTDSLFMRISLFEREQSGQDAGCALELGGAVLNVNYPFDAITVRQRRLLAPESETKYLRVGRAE